MTTRRDLLAGAGVAALATQFPLPAFAQAKDSVVIGMTLEPPTLDPTSGAAQARDEALPHPEKSTVQGPARVIPREMPGVTCATLDVDLPIRVERGGWLPVTAAARRDELPLWREMLVDEDASADASAAAAAGPRRSLPR